MTKYLALLYTNYIQPYLFPHEDESDQEHRNLHTMKILLAGQDAQNIELPIAKRAEAARGLGILAYTGGYAAAKGVGEFMPVMVDLLKSPNISDVCIITVLEGLSGVCHGHVTNQLVACSLGLLNILQFFISPASQCSTKTKLWSCSLLNILCCNNIPVIQKLRSSPSLQINLENIQTLSWVGWQKNYAEELLYIVGFWSPLPINH